MLFNLSSEQNLPRQLQVCLRNTFAEPLCEELFPSSRELGRPAFSPLFQRRRLRSPSRGRRTLRCAHRGVA